MVKFLGDERKFGKPSDRKKDSELKVVIEVYLQDSEGKKARLGESDSEDSVESATCIEGMKSQQEKQTKSAKTYPTFPRNLRTNRKSTKS